MECFLALSPSMIMAIYPNIDGEKECTDGRCLTCNLKLNSQLPGKRFNIEVSYFNGEDEVEIYCLAHAEVRRREIHDMHKNVVDRKVQAQRREDDFLGSLLDRLADQYEVKMLTPWQWRIIGVLDVYPKNRSYHDIRVNKRGGYQDVFRLCRQYFPTPK